MKFDELGKQRSVDSSYDSSESGIIHESPEIQEKAIDISPKIIEVIESENESYNPNESKVSSQTRSSHKARLKSKHKFMRGKTKFFGGAMGKKMVERMSTHTDNSIGA